MEIIELKLPECLEDCNNINCTQCYLAQSQSIFQWEPTLGECFFRKEFVDHVYLTGDFSRGAQMSKAEQSKYKKQYPPNRRWLIIIKNNLKNRRVLI